MTAGYYIGYVFHNPDAIKALRNIEQGLWIDWPTNDRMSLRKFGDSETLVLSTECDVYPARSNEAKSEVAIDLDPKWFVNRIKKDTKRLVGAIDELNKSLDPALHLPTDPKDGVRLFVYSGE